MFAYYRQIFVDRLPLPNRRTQPVDLHLAAAAEWLMRAFEADGSGGVPHSYDLRREAWGRPYPETTGYIIPTFFDYAHYSGKDEYRRAAIRMAEWEIEIQCSDGGVQSGVHDPARPNPPTIFNTGQVLFGFARAFEETADPRFKNALERASLWLVNAQDPDGAWRKFPSPFAKPGTNPYNTRTAFGLVRAFQVCQNERFLASATANAEWAASQALPNGWITGNCLTPHGDDRALTHTIAYAMRGLLEVGAVAGRADLVELAIRMARATASAQRPDGAIPGYLGPDWRPRARFSCLTGNSQLAINWQRIALITGDDSLRQNAAAANRYNMSTQYLDHADPGIRGGIKGSHPVDGDYMTNRLPNWAAKFFMDGLMLERSDFRGRNIGA